ncbi:MAG: glycosyltransferase, partial [Candidatus Omnitrophota bacterium]|nr:glycosyltransferase [Candidatus Omnitrophota bacterium]
MAIIGLDATYLSVYGKGASRYQHNLIKSLAKIDKKNYYYVFLNQKNIIPELPAQENFNYIRINIPKKIIWDQFQLPAITRKYKLDICHSASDTLPVFSKTNFVLFLFEIPDYRIEISRRSGRISLYARLSYGYNKSFFPGSLRKAKIIIASSYSTKADLIQKYGIAEEKIRLIYPAADECFHTTGSAGDSAEIRKKYNADTGYILHISSQDPRDNTPAVIRAYHKTMREPRISQKL